MDRLQRRIARRIALQHGKAEFLRLPQRGVAAVDGDDAVGRRAAGDQLARGFRSAGAEAGDDDMVLQVALDHAHPELLPQALEHEVVGGSQEEQPYEQPDRRHHERIEHPRPIGDGNDIAEADGRDGDHREIEHVDEADMPVHIVAEAAAIEPVHRQDDAEQPQHQQQAQQQRQPDRQRRLAPERREAGDVEDAARFQPRFGR
ncbi:hypothetical protein BHE75_04671 [Sphingomonas haloaromaticamans]|uniref:Uncharacterized protein n=1 Tax=Edaphosphingomonas haloaromaticamans TaxID=653954 RepID=A0A1S1H8G9_9SPHN|nr:hypothetical protein BHE75_04671 [Sphingomonas haloaromaticamans]